MMMQTDSRVLGKVKWHNIIAQRVIDLLVGVYENGCSSWLGSASVDWENLPPDTVKEDWKAGGRLNPDEYSPARSVVPTYDGGRVIFKVEVPVKSVHNYYGVFVDLPSIIGGLKIMAKKYPRHFKDLIEENDDATTADVFIQCVIFGEEVYC